MPPELKNNIALLAANIRTILIGICTAILISIYSGYQDVLRMVQEDHFKVENLAKEQIDHEARIRASELSIYKSNRFGTIPDKSDQP